MTEGSREDDFDTRSGRPSRSNVSNEPGFGPRYKVLAKVGEGGMGEVYRAYDAELKTEVALKVVRPDKDDPEASLARFRREIALSHRVTSPNVLRVFDLQEHDGLRFLSMEYVDGDDLAAVMRKGRLPSEQALAIFRQVCAGLAAAHEQGVVHRDLKPQNVLVDREGRVKVADFGLARSLGDSGLTVSGAVLGSPAYMSPEQVKGEPTDERSDIYSLGIMLYQLVSGETPFRGGTPHAVMEMRLHKAPKPLFEVEPATPPSIDAAAAKCLALNPAARFATVKDLIAALDTPVAPRRAKRRWLIPAVALGIVAAAGGVYFATRGDPTAAPTTRERPIAQAVTFAPGELVDVVIAHIDNRAGDPMFDGTIDAILTTTLHNSRLVDPIGGRRLDELAEQIAPSAAIDDAFVQKVSEAEHRRTVLVRGSVLFAKGRYAIALAATEPATGSTLLAKTIDVADVTSVVTSVVGWSRELRRALGETLPADGVEPLAISTNLEAVHELVVAGVANNLNDYAGAVQHLQRAVELDKEFAVAWAALAINHYNLGRFVDASRDQDTVVGLTERMAERDRLKFLGDYYWIARGDNARAVAEYQELLRKWPRDDAAENNLASAYVGVHQYAKAIEWGKQNFHDHPRAQLGWYNTATYEVIAGDLAGATVLLDEMMRRFPRVNAATYVYRAVIAALDGKRDDAIAAFAQLEHMNPSSSALQQADFALSESRLTDGTQLLIAGIAADRASNNADGVEAKSELLAEARLRTGDRRGALAAAGAVTTEPTRRFLAAIVQLAAGDAKSAHETATALAREVAPADRALAKLLVAEEARLAKRPDEAVATIREAIALDDNWYGHYMLARTLFDSGKLAEAEDAFRVCIARRGEGAILFLDDIATLRMMPPVMYWLARAQEAQHKREAKATYAEFLKGQATADRDPLVVDAHKRLTAL